MVEGRCGYGRSKAHARKDQKAMTGIHLPRLLSLGDWDGLPEDHNAHVELQEGVVIATPRPLRPHARAAFRIANSYFLKFRCPASSVGRFLV